MLNISLIHMNLMRTQAKLSETQGHWVWAAILWRRTGEEHNALQCENIAANLAKNVRVKLIEAPKPAVMDLNPTHNR
jgi:hypothetical protein